jgi:hypothetical protein
MYERSPEQGFEQKDSLRLAVDERLAEADYTLIEQMDDGWLQIAFQDNLDLYGGIDGKYQDLLELLRDNKAINSLICNTIERGE